MYDRDGEVLAETLAETLYDLHCHLDFARDAHLVAQDAASLGIHALTCTVTPEDYETARTTFAPWPALRVGLGMHPWWVADGRCGEEAVAQFEKLAAKARFIGEIGLDFAGVRGEETCRARQVAAFERALAACCEGAEAGGSAGGSAEADATLTGDTSPKVISLHAVRAASDVFDALARAGALEQHACVFHWFSGTSDELVRAVHAGCFFSVGPRMLKTKRGRAYARAIPARQLLLETDAPPRADTPWSARTWRSELEEALRMLAEVRAENARDLAATLAQNSTRLLA